MTSRVGVLTGAGGSAGRAIASMLANEDYALVLNDIDPFRCEGVAGRLSAYGATVLAIVGDVGDRDVADSLVEMALGAWGRLDLLVNCASVSSDLPVVETEDADWDRVCGVNLRAPFLLCRAAARAMVASGHGGDIINILPATGDSPVAGSAVVQASSAALAAFTRVLEVELAPHGVRVNAIVPGDIRNSAPGLVEGIAETVRYLISMGAKSPDGETMRVNGGVKARTGTG